MPIFNQEGQKVNNQYNMDSIRDAISDEDGMSMDDMVDILRHLQLELLHRHKIKMEVSFNFGLD